MRQPLCAGWRTLAEEERVEGAGGNEKSGRGSDVPVTSRPVTSRHIVTSRHVPPRHDIVAASVLFPVPPDAARVSSALPVDNFSDIRGQGEGVFPGIRTSLGGGFENTPPFCFTTDPWGGGWLGVFSHAKPPPLRMQ